MLVFRNRKKIAGDSSLMTYRGHTVLNTLIRSRFSPQFTTGQRYIYSGCASGAVVSKFLQFEFCLLKLIIFFNHSFVLRGFI